MTFYRRNMTGRCSYWRRLDTDEYGKGVYAPPVHMSCRWEDRTVEYRDADGELAVADSTIYVSSDIEEEGFLVKGETDDLQPSEEAKEIRYVQRSPHLSGLPILVKALV